MIPLETKQSRGKLPPPTRITEGGRVSGGVFLEKVSRSRKGNRDILLGTWNKLEGVVGTEWSWLRIGIGGGQLWVR
jgi:hypothetical protein